MKHIHGKSNTRLYRTYKHMKERCYNKNDKRYKWYGRRGITICKEWLNDFQAFYDWAISNGYNDTLTIDRIDVDGNYEPDNCRWVDMKTQANNRRSNVYLTYNGKTQTMVEWSKELNIPYRTLQDRYKKGLTDIEILNKKRIDDASITYNGKTQTIKQWAEELNINYATLRTRIYRGWDIEKCFTFKQEHRRICSYCGRIVTNDHDCPKKPKDHRRGRVLSENSTRWKKIKKEVKERDISCRLCWSRGFYSPIEECHHIIPKEVNEEKIWDVDNVIGLCHNCHMNEVHKTRDSWKDYIKIFEELIKNEK